jgi:dTDP-4-dehydrorhamnose reductase
MTKILLLGKTGQVGWELHRALAPLGAVTAWGSDELDLGDPSAVERAVGQAAPDVLVNAAAYTAVDKAEEETSAATALNAEAPAAMAAAMAGLGGWLVHYSTDYVFDGRKQGPYLEDDTPNPLGAYGRSKLAGERAIQDSGCRHLILRTAWVYAARRRNFPRTMLRLAAERDALAVVDDQVGAPTSAELIADATAQALGRVRDAAQGVYHLTAGGETSWNGFARFVIERAAARGAPLCCPPDKVARIPTSEYPTPAQRPLNSRLDTTKLRRVFGLELPHWRHHAERLVAELVPGPTTG